MYMYSGVYLDNRCGSYHDESITVLSIINEILKEQSTGCGNFYIYSDRITSDGVVLPFHFSYPYYNGKIILEKWDKCKKYLETYPVYLVSKHVYKNRIDYKITSAA